MFKAREIQQQQRRRQNALEKVLYFFYYNRPVFLEGRALISATGAQEC
jgi:hypothetical protein